MQTERGVEIAQEDLTHNFCFQSVTCPIGRFDPQEYPRLADKQFHQIEEAIYAQLELSGLFGRVQLRALNAMHTLSFLACITSRECRNRELAC